MKENVQKFLEQMEANPERYGNMSRDELLAAAAEQGLPFTVEELRECATLAMSEGELEQVSAGQAAPPKKPGERRCPHCGSKNVRKSTTLDILMSLFTGPLPAPVPSINTYCKNCHFLFIS
ncbi:MAG: Nif11-like leader peptide family natural product precursor [Eubacteriales bacterium]|nr:Nif11-like leader peptide family natural product precursor [Eubacteriales bacterium]